MRSTEIGAWKIESLDGIARILDDRGQIIVDGLSPHHARRIVLEHNDALDRATGRIKGLLGHIGGEAAQ